jgi:HEAT repeats
MDRVCLIQALACLLPATLNGQTLESRLARIANGTVHLSFAARPGTCGSGMNHVGAVEESEEWLAGCGNPPVLVSLQLRENQVVAIRTYVGGRWRSRSGVHELGTVRPQEAAVYFLKVAGQPRELSGDPVLPATLADSVTIWPALLRLARSPQLPEERRRHAIFWLGQATSSAVTGALDSIAGDGRADLEVRKQAVFALSQRSGSEGIPALIRVVRTNRDPEIRRSALFWLAQSEDPRAIDLFEDLLR